MTNKNKRLSGIFIVGCLLAVGVAVAAELASSGIFGSKHTICEGVKIGKVEVGGMTKAEAENAVDDHIAGLLSRKVVIQIGENELETDFESLGMHFSEEKLIDQAYAVGKKGNLIKRMREVENAHQSGKTFALKYSFDEQKLKEYVEKECTQFDVKAKNSKLSLKNGRFVASKERTGRELQVDQTIDRIRRRCGSDQSDFYTVQAIVETTEPKYTQEMVSKCQDLLGTLFNVLCNINGGTCDECTDGGRKDQWNNFISGQNIFHDQGDQGAHRGKWLQKCIGIFQR